MRVLTKRKISMFQIKCVAITWAILMAVSFGFSQSSDTIFEEPVLRIDKLNISEPDNVIQLYCSFSDTIWMDQLAKDKARLKLIIKQQDTVFSDVTIKKEDQVSKNSMLLSIQSPLVASMYKTEKREFTLQLVTEAKIYEAVTHAILGSVIKTFDLRPYTITYTIPLLTEAAVITTILSFILMLITPLYQKYKFKKHHIKKYNTIKEEDQSDQDPFTFVEIKDDDKVVVMEDKMMLLSSWKTLNKLPESKPAKEHAAFFKEKLEGSFFDPKTANFKKINKAWYVLIGIFLGWSFTILLTGNGFNTYTHTLSPFFDNDQLHVATIIFRDTVFGAIIGFLYSLMWNLAELFQNKDSLSYINMIIRTTKKSGVILIFFFLQSLIVAYAIQNFYIASLITWMLISVAFFLPVTTTARYKTKVVSGVAVGTLTYLFYLLLNTIYAIDLFGVEMPLFLSVLILGVLTVFFEDVSIVRSSSRHSVTNPDTLPKKEINDNKGLDNHNQGIDPKTTLANDNKAKQTEQEELIANSISTKEQSL